MSQKTNDLFTIGLNSFQGHAAELMVHMCTIQSRRPMIYGFFTDNSSFLHECVKTIPLYYMNAIDYYDEELYFPMQKVLYFNNLFYINDLYMYMCLLRDKLGTKIGVKNAKKNKYRH